MINPRSTAVLIRNRATNQFEDRTRDISEIQPQVSKSKSYSMTAISPSGTDGTA